jgi:hypothetical protein
MADAAFKRGAFGALWGGLLGIWVATISELGAQRFVRSICYSPAWLSMLCAHYLEGMSQYHCQAISRGRLSHAVHVKIKRK